MWNQAYLTLASISALLANAAQIDAVEGGYSLHAAYGPVAPVSRMKSWAKRGTSGFRLNKAARPDSYYKLRTPESCTFPFELMIIQDETAFFADDYETMKAAQLDLMFAAMGSSHPNSTYGVVSFRDMPQRGFEETKSDYCVKFRQPLTKNAEAIKNAYNKLDSDGGGDPNEHQFLAIIATAQSSARAGWKNEVATRAILIVTDSAPHFKDDGFNQPEYDLIDFIGSYDEENFLEQCKNQYYPAPHSVKAALMDREAYLIQFIYDGGNFQGERPWEAWNWMNTFLGQTSEFLNPLTSDSSNFWELLSSTIKKIEELECVYEAERTTSSTTATTVSQTTTKNEGPLTSASVTTSAVDTNSISITAGASEAGPGVTTDVSGAPPSPPDSTILKTKTINTFLAPS